MLCSKLRNLPTKTAAALAAQQQGGFRQDRIAKLRPMQFPLSGRTAWQLYSDYMHAIYLWIHVELKLVFPILLEARGLPWVCSSSFERSEKPNIQTYGG